MQLTKYAHACVTFTDGDRTLLVDPGKFTPEAAALAATADAILVTHDHFDHFDADVLADTLAKRPDLKLFGPETVRAALGDRVTVVRDGDAIEPAGFAVTVHGEHHAVIHPDIPLMSNVGFLVDGRVFHPGDAYAAPGVPVETLLLPTSGPWTKFGEAADFARTVKPARLIQIHELMLSELGQNSAATLLGENGLTGLKLENIPAGTSTAI